MRGFQLWFNESVSYHCRLLASKGQWRIHSEVRHSACRPFSISARERRGRQSRNSVKQFEDSTQEQSILSTEQYLRSLSQSIEQPTLEDLQNHRPKRLPSVHSPTYKKVYNDTLEHLSKSFTKQQLLAFEQLLGREHNKSRAKRLVLENVMEHGLSIPSPSTVDKTRRERTEIHFDSITLPASALFFLLGKDGADLLQLANNHNVHVSLAAEPLSLNVSGLKSSISAFSASVKERTKTIYVRRLNSCTLSVSTSLHLLRRTSRLTGAFLELDGSNIRINAPNKMTAQKAEHLFLYLHSKEGQRCTVPSWILDPSETRTSITKPICAHRVALFPLYRHGIFGRRSENISFFRLAKVSDRQSSPSTDSTPLQHAKVINQSSAILTLREMIECVGRQQIPLETSALILSFGQQLFEFSGSTPENNGPFLESTGISKFTDWLRNEQRTPHFLTRVPEALMTMPAKKQVPLRQLIYQSKSATTPEVSKLAETLTLNLLSVDNRKLGISSSFALELRANILIPARTYDMTINIRKEDSRQIDILPQEIQAFVEDYQKNLTALPPNWIELDGIGYSLVSYQQIQSSTLDPSGGSFESSLHSIYDILTGETSSSCTIHAKDWRKTAVWEQITTRCDDFTEAIIRQ